MNGKQLEDRLGSAWDWAIRRFPFEGYIKQERKSAYLLLARIAWQSIGENGSVLDFGAGPCDKTAIFSRIGLRVVAVDDLQDPWHKLDGNREKILSFAANAGIEYCWESAEDGHIEIPDRNFDMVMLHHVLEHLHDSPRLLLNELLSKVRERGFVFITVPNAANIRKRLSLLVGRTNYPPFGGYYWYPGSWRGHVREYVKDDLRQLAEYLGLDVVLLRSYTHFRHAIPRGCRSLLEIAGTVFPGFRDSWMLLGRKRSDWREATRISRQDRIRLLGRSEYFDYRAEDLGQEPR